MSDEKAASRFDALIKAKPEVAKKVNQIIKEEELGLTYTDRLILQLGVKNGERARFIFNEIEKIKTQKGKGDFFQELIEKRIISKEVSNQIEFLKNQ